MSFSCFFFVFVARMTVECNIFSVYLLTSSISHQKYHCFPDEKLDLENVSVQTLSNILTIERKENLSSKSGQTIK